MREGRTVALINIEPLKTELPTDYADRMGVLYASDIKKAEKKSAGQFFTSGKIARFMGSLAKTRKKNISILDPGCGTAILSCSLIEEIIRKDSSIESIDLVLYETDSQLISYTQKVIDYLDEWLAAKKILFSYKLFNKDFILDNANVFNDEITLFPIGDYQEFDYIISNPPYFKLSKDDIRTKISNKIVKGQPNIYAIFMGLASKLLNEKGQLIFIVPRSFTSGNYFRVFREYFFSNIQIKQIHLFVSRKDTFSRDNVLQELLILKGDSLLSNGYKKEIIISSSFGVSDIDSPEIRIFDQNSLIDLKTKEKIIHLPTNDYEVRVLNLFKSWNNKLRDFGIQISTGPVVAFRISKFIEESDDIESKYFVPLIWLHNVKKMCFEWPVNKSGKGQYIENCEGTKAVLVPNKNYVLLRRFSSKDDKSRLVAAPYMSEFEEFGVVGIENKVNYIYRPNGILESDEVIGLAALLNSKLFDTYFRTFNGNVNVSATELREMPFPSIETIRAIGEQLLLYNDFSQKTIDDIMSENFETIGLLNV